MNIDKEVCDRLRTKTILITGAAGMISRNVIRLIGQLNCDEGLEISVIAHVLNTEQAALLHRESDFPLQIVTGDIRTLRVTEHLLHRNHCSTF